LLKKLIIGGEINRCYKTPFSGKKIIYITSDDDLEQFENIENALVEHKEKLMKRREAANGKIKWYSLNWPRRKKLFNNEKILIRQTANRILACYDNEQWYFLKSGIIVQHPDNKKLSYYYLLCLLNSKLMDFLYQGLVGESARVFPEVKPIQLFKLPIKTVNIEAQQPFIEKADLMLSKCRELQELKADFINFLKSELKPQKISKKLENWPDSDWDQFKKELAKGKVKIKALSLKERKEWQAYFTEEKQKAAEIKSAIKNIDKEIDQMVYELYGLTEEEIKIVENAA